MAIASNWIVTHGLTYPVGFDQGNVVNNLFSNGFIPYNVIIDQDMKVIYQGSGYDMANYQSLIETELNKPPTQPREFFVVSQNPVSLDLSWLANPQADVVGYEISIEDVVKKDRVMYDLGLVTSYTIEGLQLQSSYELQLRAYDYRGNRGPWTDPLLTMTMGSVPALSTGAIVLFLAFFTTLFLMMQRKKSTEKR